MPVESGFYGDGVIATLAYDVRITARPEREKLKKRLALLSRSSGLLQIYKREE